MEKLRVCKGSAERPGFEGAARARRLSTAPVARRSASSGSGALDGGAEAAMAGDGPLAEPPEIRVLTQSGPDGILFEGRPGAEMAVDRKLYEVQRLGVAAAVLEH